MRPGPHWRAAHSTDVLLASGNASHQSAAAGKMDSRGWGAQETRCLISIWAEDSVQQKLDDTYRNRAIYEDISKMMKGNGHSRSWQQCQRKIKHLKHAFRKAKDSNNKSGGDRISCPFYAELDRVLGDRPACRLQTTTTTTTTATTHLVFAKEDEARVCLHTEPGSEIRSQVVGGDACGDAYECQVWTGPLLPCGWCVGASGLLPCVIDTIAPKLRILLEVIQRSNTTGSQYFM